MTDTPHPSFAAPAALTREQRGWLVAALVAFVGVAFVGPAITAASRRGRAVATRTRRTFRRLGGGSIETARRGVSKLSW